MTHYLGLHAFKDDLLLGHFGRAKTAGREITILTEQPRKSTEMKTMSIEVSLETTYSIHISASEHTSRAA